MDAKWLLLMLLAPYCCWVVLDDVRTEQFRNGSSGKASHVRSRTMSPCRSRNRFLTTINCRRLEEKRLKSTAQWMERTDSSALLWLWKRAGVIRQLLLVYRCICVHSTNNNTPENVKKWPFVIHTLSAIWTGQIAGRCADEVSTLIATPIFFSTILKRNDYWQ